jgi:S1-C subfamily serine protease
MTNDQQGPASTANMLLVAALLLLSGALVYQNWFTSPPVNTQPVDYVSRAAVPAGDLAVDETQRIAVFKRTAPSVVFIRTKDVARFLFSGQIHEQERELSSGTGLVWDKHGHIVTNLHVVEDALRSNESALEVVFADKSTVDAEFVGGVREFDIALLRIKVGVDGIIPIPLGTSDNLNVGQDAWAIGSPFGFDQTLSTGVIGGLNRSVSGADGSGVLSGLIQTDAAINPGNSGGPLLDSSGRMIGVNTAIVSPTGAYSGLGFAVPVSSVVTAVEMVLQATTENQRPVLGIKILSPEEALAYGATPDAARRGLYIQRIDPNGPASGLGLRPITQRGNTIYPGDQIIALNGEPTTTPEELHVALGKHASGDVITLSLIRSNGQRVSVEITLQVRKLIL